MGQPDHDRDLVAYYEQEVALGRRSRHGAHRVEMLGSFIELLRHEGRASVVDVGAGPGLDVVEFASAGLDAVGVDLTPGNVSAMRRRGLRAVCGSIYDPPLTPHSFDAVWSMSTLVHVPDSRFDQAVDGLVSLAGPDAPIAVGTWGGFDFEGRSEHGDIRPYRFFALRSHERFRELMERHGRVEQFETIVVDPASDWEYQLVVVRAS